MVAEAVATTVPHVSLLKAFSSELGHLAELVVLCALARKVQATIG
jgi:hypothetical protein